MIDANSIHREHGVAALRNVLDVATSIVRPAALITNTVRTAALLRTRTFQPIKFVVPGYISEGLTILAGRPKLGKSWFMMETALATSMAELCLGEIRCELGDVLYLALEDNERRLQSRITKLIGFSNE